MLKEKKIEHTVLNAKNHEKEAEIIANAGKLNSVIITTSISGRGVDIQLGGKININKIENNVIDEKEKVKSLGGLYVIGTEMDFIKEEFGERFIFKNPNQTSECGCGESFHV